MVSALTLPRGVKTEDTREFIAAIGALGHALRHAIQAQLDMIIKTTDHTA